MVDAEKITVALDAEIVARTREAVGDADLPDDVVVERALNAYLLGRLLDTVQATSDLSEEEAERVAVEEVRAYRRETRPRRVTRIVIDPSVYVSALIGKQGSGPDLVIRAFIDDRLEVIVSPLLVRELESVLARAKFRRNAGGPATPPAVSARIVGRARRSLGARGLGYRNRLHSPMS